jgi:plasmid stability protein
MMLRCGAGGDPAMSELSKRSTIYFDPELHRALRLKAAETHRSVSEIVNDALRQALREDQEDLAAFDERVAEPTISYEALLNDLKAHGKL